MRSRVCRGQRDRDAQHRAGVQLFQKKRDFVAQIQAGIPVYLKLGCAPLLGDEAAIFAGVPVNVTACPSLAVRLRLPEKPVAVFP